MPALSSTTLGSSQPPSHSYFFNESLSGYKTGTGCLVKCKPSVVHAKPILEVPAYFPTLSSARYKRKTVSCLITAAGLKTSFASHFTLPIMGQLNTAFVSGTSIGLTSSAFTKGSNAQPLLSFSGDELLQQQNIKLTASEI